VNLNLSPASASVRAYYSTLNRFSSGHFDNEGNIRGAFETLLKKCAVQYDWTVVPEYQLARKGQSPIRIDAALLDSFNLPRGYWEAKDEKDTLVHEMEKKFRAGYPHSNIIFQRPTEALLYKDGRIAFHDSIQEPKSLVTVLHQFYEWRQPDHESWDRAVREFSDRIPDIARGALKLINDERRTNRAFVERFAAFAQLCRESINPDLRNEAVEEMLVQHLLTERIFRRIFDNPEFTRRNVIAAEIEKVIDSLTKRHFSRDQFLRDLDPFYKAIEEAASSTETYEEKQAFLNKVYELFFKGINPRQADTLGIVYTPRPIVDFMVRSVEEVLKTEFGKTLSDKGVQILDPFVGTGTFISRIIEGIPPSRLQHKYREELHCNEVMLLPYYIACMNIEHAYMDKVGEYEPFEGICLVDTFDIKPQMLMFSESNLKRIERQRSQPIFVVIGNPPYNVGQVNENDNNKNRRYTTEGGIDARVSDTYSKSSRATNKNALSDPYVKAIRWASDRIKGNGIVALVTNSGFIDGIATDGMRMHLEREFDEIFTLDLGGNIRRNPKLSGTTHNVFGIQIGVSINIFIRREHVAAEHRKCKIHYASTDECWRKEQKFGFLNSVRSRGGVEWKILQPDSRNNWITNGLEEQFGSFRSIGGEETSVFAKHSRGVATCRDAWTYNFDERTLATNIQMTVEKYNSEIERWIRSGRPQDIDGFVQYSNDRIAWSRDLKADLKRERTGSFDRSRIRNATYRPFTKMKLYFDRILNEEVYSIPGILPSEKKELENEIIWLKVGSDWPIFALGLRTIPDLLPQGGSQCFAFYIYNEDGTNRRENITDWALAEFRRHYGESSISKRDIFHYTYALLHHPEYRTRYAANLKRELPRIPMAPDFRRYAETGAKLMKLHIDYEQQPEFPLKCTETGKLDLLQRQDPAQIQQLSHPQRHPARSLRVPPRQPQRPRVGHRPIPRLH
jgi:predicted helicase